MRSIERIDSGPNAQRSADRNRKKKLLHPPQKIDRRLALQRLATNMNRTGKANIQNGEHKTKGTGFNCAIE